MAPSTTNGDTNGSFLYPTVAETHTEGGEVYYNNPSSDDVPIREEMFGSKKKLKVIVLGCGISGVNFFKFAEDKSSNLQIVCYEKNEDIGGTCA